ncbi:hypothetical protein DM02DRAFT_647957 [Periconia macrospinosa]|uniref:Uncharacterized protein n=1 Tax=Periconia macrospinosa TaxID=97972 RepID=A0A2V1EDC3_9PLEO|nr:hypothetical protein DM02DRAFT_647957 [Periconia macrospinosa]
MPTKVEWGSPYDSGYASDIIHEEQEEEEYDSDETLSPRACRVPPRNWPTVSRQSSSSTYRSERRESSTWRPNLKKELTRQDSAASSSSTDKDDVESYCSEDMSPLDRSTSPVSRTSTPERKHSTLLHPSSPVESFTDDQYTRDFTMGPALSNAEISNNNSRVTIIAISEPTTSETPVLTSVLLRPRVPPRMPSTLLHPSPPLEGSSDMPSVTNLSLESPDSDHAFPVFTHTPPTPLPTETKFQRRVSVIHSSLSEDEWEDPLHSSHSDVESDSENDDVGESISGETDMKLPNSQDTNGAVSVAKSALGLNGMVFEGIKNGYEPPVELEELLYNAIQLR